MLAGNLGALPPPESPPVLILVSGLPGTGKSHFSRRLAGRLPYLVLESDALRKQLFPAPAYSREESARLFRAVYRLIDDLLGRGIPLVFDATNLEERHRQRLYRIADKRGAKLIIVGVKAPEALVYKRLAARARRRPAGEHSDADWAVYRKLKPTAEEIGRRQFIVDTSRDIKLVLDRLVREAKRKKGFNI